MTNETSKITKFETLMKYAEKMNSRYFHALSSFYAYEALCDLVAPNVVGKDEAMKNVAVFKTYSDFFVLSKETLRIYFFLELAKLFDVSNGSLHINKIVNFTESNLKHLTVEAFKEYNKDQVPAFLENLVNTYKGVAHTDLIVVRNLLEKHKITIEKLKTYRNKWLAHDEINKSKPPSINATEIKALFGILEKILNLITGQLNSKTWMYDHVEDRVKQHTKLVVNHLRRFEPYRLREIDDECQAELSRYKSGKAI